MRAAAFCGALHSHPYPWPSWRHVRQRMRQLLTTGPDSMSAGISAMPPPIPTGPSERTRRSAASVSGSGQAETLRPGASHCGIYSALITSSLVDLGLLVQNHVQQGTVDFNLAVVINKTQFPKSVHAKAHARSPRADHLRQCLLADFRYDCLRPTFLAKIRQKPKRPCHPSPA